MTKDATKNKPKPGADRIGRPPPHDLDAEAAVLGAVLYPRGACPGILTNVDALDRVADILGPEDFYSDANGRIYLAAQEIAEARGAFDLVMVADWLREREWLQHMGGPAYLRELCGVPGESNLEAHARIIRNKARIRRLIDSCQRIAADAYGEVGDAESFIDGAEGELHAIAMDRPVERDDTARTIVREMESRPRDARRGIPIGLADLDRLIGGMRDQQLIVVGALPGCGKTALGLGAAVHTARTPGLEALVFSLEMEREELLERAIFGEAQVDAAKLVEPESITGEEWARHTSAAAELALDSLHIHDRKTMTLMQMRAYARRTQASARRRGRRLALIVVDYLQLMKLGGKRPDSREQEVAEISRFLKALAGELEVPVIALAQLNDASLNRPDRRPRAGDLRESRAIWADADKVILIHAPHALERARAGGSAWRGEEHDVFPPEEVELIADKNRGGRTGTRSVLFWPSYVKFTNYARGHASVVELPRDREEAAVPRAPRAANGNGARRYGNGSRGPIGEA